MLYGIKLQTQQPLTIFYWYDRLFKYIRNTFGPEDRNQCCVAVHNLPNGLDVYLDSVFVMTEIFIYARKKVQISNVIHLRTNPKLWKIILDVYSSYCAWQ